MFAMDGGDFIGHGVPVGDVEGGECREGSTEGVARGSDAAHLLAIHGQHLTQRHMHLTLCNRHVQ